MNRLFLSLAITGSLWWLLGHLRCFHLAIINEGSRAREHAFPIDDITLAQAFYGTLAQQTSDYYRFRALPNATLRLSMLVPDTHYHRGFRPTIILWGAGLPDTGMILPSGNKGSRAGTTDYQRTQQEDITLSGGDYLLAVHSEQPGVYCFCVGTREGASADETTRQRVRTLLGIS